MTYCELNHWLRLQIPVPKRTPDRMLRVDSVLDDFSAKTLTESCRSICRFAQFAIQPIFIEPSGSG